MGFVGVPILTAKIRRRGNQGYGSIFLTHVGRIQKCLRQERIGPWVPHL